MSKDSKVKVYTLRIVLEADSDELLHLEESFTSEDILRFSVGDKEFEVSEELEKALRDLGSNILGLT